MYRLLEFIRSISLLLLFLFLEGAAILFYARSDSYTQAKIFGLTSNISGGIGGVTSSISSYFNLREENQRLLHRIIELEQSVNALQRMHSDSLLQSHSMVDERQMTYIAARAVRNTTNRSKNLIIINRGIESGVRQRMAVITPRGELVGSVVGATDRYAVVMSLLNSDFNSSGKVKGSNYVGALSWDGRDRYTVQLNELSKYANVFEGAEITTTGLSRIFPVGLKIGRVANFTYNESEGAYSVNVELAADLSAIDELIVINSLRMSEVEQVMEDFMHDGKLEEQIEGAVKIEETEDTEIEEATDSEERQIKEIETQIDESPSETAEPQHQAIEEKL